MSHSEHSLFSVKLVFLIFIIFSSSVSALETDNYLAWRFELSDSSGAINEFFNEEIRSVLRESENEKSCEEITKKIGEVFESRLVHDNPVENYLLEVLRPGEIYPTDLFHVQESIYRNPYRFYIPYFGLAPTIQVKGFYFGTDKLSHFASTGRIYYNIYKKNFSVEEAVKWGVKDEKSVHGYWASGVFSYADLEANFQGLRFYQSLCEGSSPYLKFNGESWTLKKPFRIQEYVSGLWDETFLESYRLPGNWKKVKEVLKEEYCPLKDSSIVLERFRYYKDHLPKSSTLTLLKKSNLPKAQSFQGLCSTR